jgi:hypothetical protein
MYVIALEWGEGWSKAEVTAAGEYIQAHNPWQRLLSVHNRSDWAFSGESWATFIATQRGNNSTPDAVNDLAVKFRTEETIPHMDEEFGFLRHDSNERLRGNLWANFAGGAAGSGTGSDLRAFQSFLSQSQIPFQRMAPASHLVEDGGSERFVLAEMGHHFLVYSRSGSFDLSVSGSNLQGYWFNPMDPQATLGVAFPVASGQHSFTPPDTTNNDWVLWITDRTDLNAANTHPSAGSAIVQQVISPNGGQDANLPRLQSTFSRVIADQRCRERDS